MDWFSNLFSSGTRGFTQNPTIYELGQPPRAFDSSRSAMTNILSGIDYPPMLDSWKNTLPTSTDPIAGLLGPILSDGNKFGAAVGLVSSVLGGMQDNRNAAVLNQLQSEMLGQNYAMQGQAIQSYGQFQAGLGELRLREADRNASFHGFDSQLQQINADTRSEINAAQLRQLQLQNDAKLSDRVVNMRRGARYSDGADPVIQEMGAAQVLEEQTLAHRGRLDIANLEAAALKSEYSRVRALEQGREAKYELDGRTALDTYQAQMQMMNTAFEKLALDFERGNMSMFDGVITDAARFLPVILKGMGGEGNFIMNALTSLGTVSMGPISTPTGAS